MCTPCSECVADVYVVVKKHLCNVTPAHALSRVPRTPVPKCTQHSLQKNAHMHTHTHIFTHIHMHTSTHAHPSHWLTRRSTFPETHSNLYKNIHTHIYTHIHTCIRIYIHIHIHKTYTCSNTHIHIHIYKHIQHVNMQERKHAWNNSAGTTVQIDVDAGSSARVFRSTKSTTFNTSNTRTPLYPLHETPIQLNSPSSLPNIP